jgi:hypothetical protein
MERPAPANLKVVVSRFSRYMNKPLLFWSARFTLVRMFHQLSDFKAENGNCDRGRATLQHYSALLGELLDRYDRSVVCGWRRGKNKETRFSPVGTTSIELTTCV